MMRTKFIIALAFFSTLAFSQQLQLQFGSSISYLDWNYKAANFDLGYDQPIVGNSIMAGINYWNHNYFNMTSNLGYLKKGGRVGNYNSESGLDRVVGSSSSPDIYSELNYLTFNTLFELKYPLHKTLTSVFSFGPRIDYLIDSKGEIQSVEDVNELNNVIGGFIVGGGFRYFINNMIVGIRGDFYMNSNSVADWAMNDNNIGGEIKDNTMTVNFTVAYNISRDPHKKAWRSACKKQW